MLQVECRAWCRTEDCWALVQVRLPLHGVCLPVVQELFQQHALERATLQKECCASEEALQSQRRHQEHHLLSASLTDRITDELWGGLAGSWQQFRSTGES